MKKIIKLFSFTVLLLLISSNFLFAERVKSLDFTAVTRNKKVEVVINSKHLALDYLTPKKNYNYEILDYDYSFDHDNNSWVLEGTVRDTLFNTASDFIIYSNDRFTEMRLGKEVITFIYVENFKLDK